MKAELLPTSNKDVSLEKAFQIIMDTGTDKTSALGIVAVDGKKATVLSAADILYSIRQIGSDKPLEALLARPSIQSRTRLLEEMEPGALPDSTWVTDAQLLSMLRSAASICICSQNPEHVFISTELVTPGKCNIDGSDTTCT